MTVLRKYYIKYKYNSKTLGYKTISGFCLKECLGTLSSPDSWPKLSISKAVSTLCLNLLCLPKRNPTDWGLNNRKLFLTLESGKFKISVPADLASVEGCLPGLQMVTFSPCPLMWRKISLVASYDLI